MPLNVIVQRLDQLPNLTAAKSIVFDTETSGLRPHHGDRMCGFVIGAADQDVNYYVPLRHTRPGAYENVPLQNALDWLRSWMQDASKIWVGQNLKFDLHMLRADGIEMAGSVWDTMIAAHICRGDRMTYALDVLTRIYLPDFKHVQLERLEAHLKETQKTPSTDEGKAPYNYSLAPIETLGPYACEDAQATRLLARHLSGEAILRTPRIPNQGHPAHSTEELLQSDMQLIKVLFEMEWAGIKIDIPKCRDLYDKTEDEIGMYADRLAKLCGHSFSIGSTPELEKALVDAGGEVLFWNKPQEQKGKQKDDQFTTIKAQSTGNACFNAAALLRYLDHFKKQGNVNAYSFLLTWHEADSRQRLLNTNLSAYLRLADARGYLHTSFHQHRTVTGRLSSSDTNLQNVARVKGTVDQKQLEKAIGQKAEDALNKKLRDLFVAEPGDCIISCDQSQAEYRAAAYFSRDQDMIRRYREDPMTDYHEVTAQAAGIDRDWAKNVSFGALYGMGAKGLASFLHISVAEAKTIIEKVMGTKPALKELLENTAGFAAKYGYVQNPCGRICHTPKGKEYVGINYLIQGAIGDTMRESLVRIFCNIQQQRLPAVLRLSVHDEVVATCPRDAVRDVAPKLSEWLCDVPWMGTVPMRGDIEVGRNWGRDLVSLAEWLEKYPGGREIIAA